MKNYFVFGCLILLSACQSATPDKQVLAAQAVSSAEPANTESEIISPSFDCNQAQGQVETLICNDAELAELDQKMAQVYQMAVVNIPESEQPKAVQRGWIKGRNDCWKAQDVRECTLANYQIRLVELLIQGELVQATNKATFDCSTHASISGAFYTQFDPVMAVFTFANQQMLAINVRSGSGAKYQGRNFEFWEHQGEASVEYLGERYQCKLQQ